MSNSSPGLAPLDAPTLIEASAGTGKTYTITTYFVRGIVEHGYRPEQILVVTYTKAATAELRIRARERTLDALDRLDGTRRGADDVDQVLATATARWGRDEVAARLQRALGAMDQASILTIHGFCQRLLQDHPLSFGIDFEFEVAENLTSVYDELATDFWATDLYDKPEWLVRALHARKIGPAHLAALAKAATTPEAEILGPEPAPPEPAVVDRVLRLHREAARIWREHRDVITEILLEYDGFNRNKYRKSSIRSTWLPELDAFFDKPGLEPPPECFAKLARGRMGVNKGRDEPTHPFFDACAALLEGHDAWAPMIDYEAFRFEQRFLEFVRDETRRRQRETSVLSFDDLLTSVHAPLASGSIDSIELAQAIARDYPLALVDEFQDTDPLQYGIFRSIYGRGMAVYVGDPKQAIYAFRGADVFSYIAAKEDVGTRRHTLRTNRRSDPSLVRAVNTLFSRQKAPFVLDGIDFESALAHREQDRSSLRPAMEIALLERSRLDGPIARAVAPVLANEVAHLLRSEAQIDGRPVEPGDIAVLCRSNAQATEVTQALRSLNIATSLDGDSSVLQTEVADDLRAVLEAALMPADAPALRRAMLTRLLGVAPRELAAICDAEWTAWLTLFHDWHETWHRQGVVRFLEDMLRMTRAEERLAAGQAGRRELTDLLHLQELLMRGERERRRDPVALMQWFRRLDEGTPERGMVAFEDLQQRPDAETGVVRVSTVHKSKGLEYGIVFCPFTWDDAVLWPFERSAVKFHDAQGNIQLDLGSPRKDVHEERAAMEKLAEAVRLLYVAVTRAKHRCTLFWGRPRSWKPSALGYLLHGDRMSNGPTEQELRSEVERLAEASDGTIGCRSARSVPASPFVDLGPETRLAAQPVSRVYDLSARIGSFTSLTGHDEKTPGAKGKESSEPLQSLLFAGLPGGTRTGLLLHAILERVDLAEIEADAALGIISEQLATFGFGATLASEVQRDLATVAATPLFDADGAPRLADLDAHRQLRELEFTMHATRPELRALAELLREHGAPESVPTYHERLRELGPSVLQPFLRGYIDLVFEWDTRWYVVDYKSNTLPAYDGDNVLEAVERQHYLLQAQLYTAAANRYLRQRVEGYDPDTHWGGALFLFLRGMDPGNVGQGIFFDRQTGPLLQAVDQWLGGGRASR